MIRPTSLDDGSRIFFQHCDDESGLAEATFPGQPLQYEVVNCLSYSQRGSLQAFKPSR